MTAKETKDVLEKYIKCAYSPSSCLNDDLSCAGCELLITENEWDEALKTAIEILEKQVPKKPEEKLSEEAVKYQLYCPICGNYIGYRGLITGRLVKFGNENYCGKCGQAIDYKDGEG